MIHTPQIVFIHFVNSEITGDQIPQTEVRLNFIVYKMRESLSQFLHFYFYFYFTAYFILSQFL